jgi:hypothetical protein
MFDSLSIKDSYNAVLVTEVFIGEDVDGFSALTWTGS